MQNGRIGQWLTSRMESEFWQQSRAVVIMQGDGEMESFLEPELPKAGFRAQRRTVYNQGITTLVASETAFTGNCTIWICVHPRTQHKGSLWQLRNGFDFQGLSSEYNYAQWSSLFLFFLDYKSCGVKCLMQSLGAYWSCASDLSHGR